MNNQKQVFEGIKVAEFAWAAVGPCSSKYLADHGATVVKIESHNRLDTLRVTSPYSGGQPHVDGSMYYGRHNSNKYGVSLDLGNPGGREIAMKLIMWADIVTESFSPRVMVGWGLDYESVKKVKPDIIYLSSSMQGRGGPHTNFTGYGQSACSLCGFSEISGWPDRMPAAPHGAYTDYICPRFNAIAIIAALEYRKRTGQGQWIEQSQFETSLHFFSPPLMDYQINGNIMGRNGNRLPYASPHGVFQCKGDDNWVAIAIFSEEEWQVFCEAAGKPAWAKDKRFADFSQRKKNEDQLEKLITEWTLQYTREEVEAALQKVNVIANSVEKSSDIYNDPQLHYRSYFAYLNHPVMGEQAFEPQSCFLLSKTPRQINRPSPCIGEHNEYVFKQLLGMTDDEIANYLINGSITTELPGEFKPNM